MHLLGLQVYEDITCNRQYIWEIHLFQGILEESPRNLQKKARLLYQWIDVVAF